MRLIFFLVIFCLLQCCTNHGQLMPIEKLPKKLNETSGVVSYSKSTAWLIEDSGNSNHIYKTDFKGHIIKKLQVKNAKNIDWEDLTKDSKGNLYIGDFGNNKNTRKNLSILKLHNPELEKGDKIKSKKIQFNFPEQRHFPPSEKEKNYDVEAFFHYNGHLYLFTKNRTKPFSGETLVYRIPSHKGTYKATLIGKIKIGSDWDTCRITSAAISPNRKTIVLLSYGKLWIITDFKKDNFAKGTIKQVDLGIRTQLESVCFLSQTKLLLSDEKKGNTGGYLYTYQLN